MTMCLFFISVMCLITVLAIGLYLREADRRDAS